MRGTNLLLRRHSPRIACLRLSKTLVYLYRRELEIEPVSLPVVAVRFVWQHRRNNCRNSQIRSKYIA